MGFNSDLSSDSDSASNIDDENSSYNDYKYEPRSTRRNKSIGSNPIKKMRDVRKRRMKNHSPDSRERRALKHLSDNESSRQSTPNLPVEIWELEQWVAKPQSTTSDFNWLECIECNSFSYIPQVVFVHY